ncbi:hypothetical protein SUGI_0554730 [Cryptomeria japonica]|nr:hypothetical protein SUGI_0554730 [Cryptomeria japonica]
MAENAAAEGEDKPDKQKAKPKGRLKYCTDGDTSSLAARPTIWYTVPTRVRAGCPRCPGCPAEKQVPSSILTPFFQLTFRHRKPKAGKEKNIKCVEVVEYGLKFSVFLWIRIQLGDLNILSSYSKVAVGNFAGFETKFKTYCEIVVQSLCDEPGLVENVLSCF